MLEKKINSMLQVSHNICCYFVCRQMQGQISSYLNVSSEGIIIKKVQYIQYSFYKYVIMTSIM